MDELKPCPFCGGEAELRTGMEGSLVPHLAYALCTCKKCGSNSASFNDTAHNGKYVFDAIEAWNRRENGEVKKGNET